LPVADRSAWSDCKADRFTPESSTLVKDILFAVAALSLPAAAGAQPAAEAPATPLSGVTVAVPRRTTVSELAVALPVKCLPARRPADPDIPAPKVVSTFPANGAVVRPGILVLRVTFDLPMSCEGLLTEAAPARNPCPGSTREMLLSYDRRTFRTVCTLDQNTRYGLWTNHGFFHKFTSLAGRPSDSYKLTFATSSQTPVVTVKDALAEDQDAAATTTGAPAG
jgi:hypothetical protein